MAVDKQIKSKERVVQHGEVFTADREVNAMLDLVNDEIKRINSTVLEPACGEGAFILKIFERKMSQIELFDHEGWTKEYLTLQAVSSIYGVDIQKDNVLECRSNLIDSVLLHFHNPSSEFMKMLKEIVSRNIICGNTLTMSCKGNKPLKVSEWFFSMNGEISRCQYLYSELIQNGGECNSKKRLIKYDFMKKESKYVSINTVLA